jgi:hypothetical protein
MRAVVSGRVPIVGPVRAIGTAIITVVVWPIDPAIIAIAMRVISPPVIAVTVGPVIPHDPHWTVGVAIAVNPPVRDMAAVMMAVVTHVGSRD